MVRSQTRYGAVAGIAVEFVEHRFFAGRCAWRRRAYPESDAICNHFHPRLSYTD